MPEAYLYMPPVFLEGGIERGGGEGFFQLGASLGLLLGQELMKRNLRSEILAFLMRQKRAEQEGKIKVIGEQKLWEDEAGNFRGYIPVDEEFLRKAGVRELMTIRNILLTQGQPIGRERIAKLEELERKKEVGETKLKQLIARFAEPQALLALPPSELADIDIEKIIKKMEEEEKRKKELEREKMRMLRGLVGRVGGGGLRIGAGGLGTEAITSLIRKEIETQLTPLKQFLEELMKEKEEEKKTEERKSEAGEETITLTKKDFDEIINRIRALERPFLLR